MILCLPYRPIHSVCPGYTDYTVYRFSHYFLYSLALYSGNFYRAFSIPFSLQNFPRLLLMSFALCYVLIKCLFISVINQLEAQNLCFTINLFRLYMFRAHVLTIWSKLHYTASGIIAPIGVILRCTVSKTSK